MEVLVHQKAQDTIDAKVEQMLAKAITFSALIKALFLLECCARRGGNSSARFYEVLMVMV